MATLRSDTISGIGTEGPVLNGGLHFRSKNYLTLPKGTTTERTATSSGISTVIGAIRYNTDSNKMECYVNNKWMIVSTSSPNLDGGARGLFYRGYVGPANSDVIDYVTIPSAGNAIDFGDSLATARQAGATGSNTRAVVVGRDSANDTIEFVTFSSTGDAADFGDSTANRAGAPSAVSNGTRGIFAGGEAPSLTNLIDYITIAQTGNAIDFGDLSVIHSDGARAQSPTRGIIAGGRTSPNPYTNVIEFITMSTLGNGTDFGDLTVARNELASDSNSTRGIFTGGSTPSDVNIMEYITIASTGNSTDFGDQSAATNSGRGSASSTRFVFALGSSDKSIIEYVQIATQGDSVDFGDLTVSRSQAAGVSNAHGGL